MESTIKEKQQKIIYLKWAPVNETEKKEKSYGKDKKKVEERCVIDFEFTPMRPAVCTFC